MKISYNWLKQFIEIDWDAEQTAELLTDLGLEVEGITAFQSVKGGLDGIVVGEVVDCVKHPNADKLKLTRVELGNGEPVQIVCGAPNVAKGQKVPVATIGTTLYTPEGEAWTIKKGKIRGEASHGMICAEDELGLGESHDGIMVLDEKLEPGTPCSKIFEIENDQVFEIGLTPNRADAMSHYGVARDLKAGLLQKKIHCALNTPSVSNFHIDNRSLKIDIEVDHTDLAPRYAGITLTNLEVKASPDWLQNRLKAIGLKPINNVVDATNYVLHELGQPLHAFDADRIHGKKVIVKKAKEGTKFVTLDGIEHSLHKDDLMICDSEKPMCIAGIFGGINTGVTENTRNIFLESAYFDPVSVRKTAKRHGLNTDASFRFERGIDINNVEYSLQRAALLIKELTGGEISSDLVDFYPRKKEDSHVFLTFEKINNLIGQEIPQDTIKSILASLDIQVRSVTESGLGLVIPFYRIDVQREVDVIEEILRVYGYNNIEVNEKWNTSVAPSSLQENHRLQDMAGEMLAAKGFFEIMTNSLTNPEYQEPLGNTDTAVKVLNPLSNELSALRQHMLFSGLEAIAYNQNRQQDNLKFFEFGSTYRTKEGGYQETKELALWVSGFRSQESWMQERRTSDFFYLKGVVEQLLQRLGAGQYEITPFEDPIFSEGISFRKGDRVLAELGVVQSKLCKKMDVRTEVLYASVDWEKVARLSRKNRILYQDISKFPEVRRDLALLVDEKVSFKDIYDLAQKTERKLLKKVNLFDVYKGDSLPEGKKSYAVSFIIQDPKKTLTDKQIDKIMKKLQLRFSEELGAELR